MEEAHLRQLKEEDMMVIANTEHEFVGITSSFNGEERLVPLDASSIQTRPASVYFDIISGPSYMAPKRSSLD